VKEWTSWTLLRVVCVKEWTSWTLLRVACVKEWTSWTLLRVCVCEGVDFLDTSESCARSQRLRMEIEPQIERSGAVRERSNGDEVHPGGRYLADTVEPYTSAGFHQGAASYLLHARAEFF
jgi:hypothetical protein